ncbi:hypothetical protein BBF96_01045 [Anoxybacter fermentans]|uniref:ABC transporter domain-containing protein n=1 Tax=Anoxybacter fermentans TaxID=1323375 RepID=A0A3S9SV17_9FIRM|nr:ABC transporter ATP-binding protein [Anoxybacter fermentans]AZR72100.1 hypothetical protein BBF96_01045 [Anoxybacter fermentans]
MDYAIEVQGLSKKFAEKYAVKDLNFQIQRGEIVAFLGPNGAGKTTTVRLLNGVLRPTAGTIKILGYELNRDVIKIQSRTGVVTETFTLYERLTGRYNLKFYGNLYGLKTDVINHKISAMISFFNFEDYIDRPVETYSTGMKKKLSLARALLHDPEILFLDEPTTGLDPEASRTVIKYIAKLNQEEKKTIFLCTHNLEVAEILATRIMLIDKGQLITIGTPDELKKKLWPDVQVDIECKMWGNEKKEKIYEIDWITDIKDIGNKEGVTKLSINVAERKYIPDLVEILIQQGCRIFSVVEKEHSLEEIYFKLREGKK